MSLSNFTKAASAVALITGLSACGGGETSGGGGAGTTTYSSLSDTSRSTAMNLRASGLATSGGTTTVDNGSGNFTPSTGSIVVSDGAVTLRDTNGPNSGGVYEDSSGATFSPYTVLSSAGYDYLSLGNLNYTDGGDTYNVVLVYGAATSTADMGSASGSVIYNGAAAATAIDATNRYDLTDGTATITVDFDASNQQVDAVLTGFTVTGLPTNTAAIPFDTIDLNNMTISDNVFSGGDIATTSAGTLVLFAGAGATDATDGSFFALDGNVPDELGGVFLSDGSSGTVQGVFVGD